MLYFREIYHGGVWNTDSHFPAPMVKLSDGKSIVLRDCIYHAELGTVVGMVVKFFQEVSLPPRILSIASKFCVLQHFMLLVSW